MHLSKLLILALVGVVTACAPMRHSLGLDDYPVRREFWQTVASAQRAADSAKYARADSILAGFAVQRAGTQEAREVEFWRAVYKTDPSNKKSTTRSGIEALEKYLATDGAWWYKEQAQILKRSAYALEAARASRSVTSGATDTVTVYRSREEEVASLREQLARANSELERIKKRLTNPGT